MRLIVAAACILSCTLPCAVWAQVDVGQISGTVVDSSGATVPGIRVLATNEGTHNSQAATTNSSGYYMFSNLLVGSYTITAEIKGFQKYVRKGILLNAASQLTVPIKLTLGAVTQTVVVTGTAAQALSLQPSTGGTVTANQFKQLEVNGRNPVYLTLLEPGVVGTHIGKFDPDSVSSGALSMNGGRTDAYTVYV
ncbi:MAG: carboxypeptidase-like regulatory domain-containing protein, partial [Bryobacteraceae bacterium]